MKKFRTTLFLAALVISGAYAPAQTADEVISKYLQAIGGKDFIANINSLYTESSMDIMGNETTQKVTVLNGKGYKQELEIMGSSIVTCFTENGGWTINPMTGGNDAVEMPAEQFNAGKDQIFVGGALLDYSEKGYKAELAGNGPVGAVDAIKVKLTSPDNNSSLFFFDPSTGHLLRTVQQTEVQGQIVDNTITFTDYRTTEGYTVPHTINIDIGGMFDMAATVTKVEINKPVDAAIFAKP